tara:strand:- start:397 stop:726 length:330 start_codon:yes stop_codon:yes gene_type:complete
VWEKRWWVTEVGIHDTEHITLRRRKSLHDGTSETKLARPMYDLHVVVLLRQLVGDFTRSIWRIVVHDDDLSANAYASKDAGDGVDQFGELLALIVSGNDDREFHISKSL